MPRPALSRRVPVAAVLALGLLAGCGSSGSSTRAVATPSATGTPALSGSVTVLAAASLTKAFTALAAQFEAAHPGTKVVLSFGPSSGLAQQVLAGAPADLFASASPKNMAQVTDAGDASDPRTFAKNVAEVAVAPARKAAITTLADRGKPGVKVARCAPTVPCGALALKVLGKAHVTVRPVTQGLDVKSTLAYVTSGQVDAAVVYVTDVLAAGSKVVGLPVPPSVNASTDYLIAPVKGGRTALAQAFEDLVLSPAGRAALSAAGFSAP
ncbi:MAG: molybdate ABC transporter substrate-binding protein [Mycobacteriales bacterium]